jgi:predicted peptidase
MSEFYKSIIHCMGKVLSLAFLLVATQSFSQVHNSMEGRSYRSGSVTMMYRLFIPKNYNPQTKYPLLVATHGVGEKGEDNNIQVDREDLASTWIADSLQNRVPHFVMAPQSPTALSWGNAQAIDMIHGIIDSLKREFSLDTNRLYSVGLSMGARGVFNLVQSRPGYFAAALACAGAGNNSGAAAIGRTPLWAFHATGDNIVVVEGTRSMVNAIEASGKKFLRYFSEAWTPAPGLDTYSKARLSGTSQLDMVAKNPSGISYDSLKRAVAGGEKYLYSEIIGGDHRTGWMVAFHHPLVPAWIFAQTKASPTVSLFAKNQSGQNQAAHNSQAFLFRNGSTELYWGSEGVIDLMGRNRTQTQRSGTMMIPVSSTP